jgi:hypothetical protein
MAPAQGWHAQIEKRKQFFFQKNISESVGERNKDFAQWVFIIVCHRIHAIILLKKNLQDEGTSRTHVKCTWHSQASFQNAMVLDACARQNFARISHAKVFIEMLGTARVRRFPLPEIVLWTTASQHPSESQTSECSDLLSRSRATLLIAAQRQPGKLNKRWAHASYWNNFTSNAAAFLISVCSLLVQKFF